MKRLLKLMFRTALHVALTLLILGGVGVYFAFERLEVEIEALRPEMRERVAGLRRFESTRAGWSFPSTVYSDWYAFPAGTGAGIDRLLREARARGYSKGEDPGSLAPGEYVEFKKTELTVHVRGFDYPEGRTADAIFLVKGERGKLKSVEQLDGPKWAIEPRLEPLYLDTWIPENNELRLYRPLADFPQHLKQAVIASEDGRFHEHMGIDLKGIARAVRRNVMEGAPVEGASTLTQQVIRTFFLSRERSFRRKVREALMAMALEREMGKDEVLELYLNSVYLGQIGGRSIGGFAAGARHYFDVDLKVLTLAQATALVAIVPAPVAYSPLKNPAQTLRLRERVLDLMREGGIIDAETAKAAQTESIVLKHPAPAPTRWPLYAQWARRYLTEHFGLKNGDPTGRGLRVYTGLSPGLQLQAESLLALTIGELEASLGVWKKDPIQGATLGVDPQTGFAPFAVGSRGNEGDQYHRAVQMRRQPGSAIKPVAYAAVLSELDAKGRHRYTPAHTVADERRSFETLEGPWSPRNSDGIYHPWVTLAKAFAKSMNVATTNLVVEIGPQKVADMAKALGINSTLRVVPSIGLGSSEVTMPELVGALSAVATLGKRVDVSPIRVATGLSGKVVMQHQPPHVQGMAPDVATMVLGLMKNSFERGTGYKARLELGSAREVAGKTGTSQQGRDLWFVGVARNLAVGLWAGHDQGHAIWEIAGDTIAPAWGRMVRPLYDDLERQPFDVADTVQRFEIDAYSGCKGGNFPVFQPKGLGLPTCRPLDWEVPKREETDEEKEARRNKGLKRAKR